MLSATGPSIRCVQLDLINLMKSQKYLSVHVYLLFTCSYLFIYIYLLNYTNKLNIDVQPNML